MLKAIRRHLKSKKTTNFMQYMKINRKDSNDFSLNDITNDLDANYYRNSDCFGFIRTNNYYNVSKSTALPEISEQSVHSFGKIRLNYQHLHALHRFRRQRKRGIASDKDVVISFLPRLRFSIVNRFDLFYRFGKQEQEAIACFDFLYDIQTDNNETNSLYEMDITERSNLNAITFQNILNNDKDIDNVSNSSVDSVDTDSLVDQNRLSLSDSCTEYNGQFSD